MYELTFLAKSTLSEEEMVSLLEQIKKVIAAQEGEITQDFTSKQIYLSYPIKKNSHAFLCSVDFELDKEKIKNIEQQVKNNEQIFRYLIITKKPPQPERPAKKARKTTTKTKAPKVKIEDLDKKLEEILEE